MRVLHVACMPFPSPQGTQAAVRSMLDASVEAGHEAHALVYGFGASGPTGSAVLHRLPTRRTVRPARSLRSGPSLEKIGLDLRAVTETRRLVASLAPDLVVAHHVEAALAVGAARLRTPTCMIAHAVLGTELPTYFPRALAPIARRIGRELDRRAVESTGRVFAVAPSVASALAGETDARIRAIATPWRATGPKAPRAEARRSLDVPPDARAVLYAGNLDRYQSWELALATIADPRLRSPAVRLIVATESAPDRLLRVADHLGVRERVHVVPLAGKADRERAHGAADVAFVPRGPSPGIPIKLLDALSRGTPVVATRRATAGLPLAAVAEIVPDDDAAAAASAIAHLLDAPAVAGDLIAGGRAYLRKEHGPERYVATLEALSKGHVA